MCQRQQCITLPNITGDGEGELLIHGAVSRHTACEDSVCCLRTGYNENNIHKLVMEGQPSHDIFALQTAFYLAMSMTSVLPVLSPLTALFQSHVSYKYIKNPITWYRLMHNCGNIFATTYQSCIIITAVYYVIQNKWQGRMATW